MKYDAEAMMAACRRQAPLEACGLVWADGMTMELDNVRTTPGAYLMNEGQFFEAVNRYGMFAAIWHTHPSGNVQPSATDERFHRGSYPDLAMIIATPEVTAVYAFDDGQEAPLVVPEGAS